ncbi:MAG TPA: methionyl-tRNA formyltransferase [Candidatus Hydrogenedentes bacterium]|nr:methionyl-tRNA formyltransferase [Candidatus Hydrogenedentota bacterium]HIJ74382.1 methionyl-tRNA formyltransferase [Candidatus Hydrogenedentota bacterium]
MRIAVAGVGGLAATLLDALSESNHEIVAVIQNGRRTRGWARAWLRLTARIGSPKLSALSFALRNGIPVLWLDRMDEEELAPLRRVEPDLLLVGGFSIILKKPILDLPKIGCVNTHSSLLPKHRGPNPFSAVVLANETESGVTFHVVDEGVDTGDIIEQVRFSLGPRETSFSVHKKACRAAAAHVAQVMDRIEAEGLKGTPQDHAAATYDSKLEGEALHVVWDTSAGEIERLTRGCQNPRPWFTHRGKKVRLVRVRARNDSHEAPPGTILLLKPRLTVAAGKGTIEVVFAYAKRPVPWLWPAFWNRVAVGDILD